MDVLISAHARAQMEERGAKEAEVLLALRSGEREPVQRRRTMYRKNFEFDEEWRGKHYMIKQVAPVVALDGDTLIVVTVYVFYF